MLKIEKYYNQLQELTENNCDFGVDKDTDEPIDCVCGECDFCLFENSISCTTSRIKWLIEEAKESILTEKEKEYLSVVIKPFRTRIVCVEKKSFNDKFQFIVISYAYPYDNTRFLDTVLPLFEKNTMFKNMEPYKKYRLEDLGL